MKLLLLCAVALPLLAQTPAFPGQTKAPAPARPSTGFEVQTIAAGLDGAWAVAFLPSGNFLVTQNNGSMRIVRPNGVISAPLAGMPAVKSVAAQGLHDVVLDPDFARNRTIYFTYFAPPKGEAPATWPIEHFYEEVWTRPLAERRTMSLGMERVAKARLSEDETHLENVDVIFDGAGDRRIVIGRDGLLYIAGADRFRFYPSKLEGMEHPLLDNPDELRNFTGRVVRITKDGRIPAGNPWLDRATVLPETWAHGLKDPEGMTLNPATGELWAIDHGPQGGDEINIIRPGRDYGWPNVTYGHQYDARQADGRKNVKVGTGLTAMAGVEQPLYFWFPSIAPSGMMFYTGDLFPEWKGNLFIGAMAGQHLVRLVLDGTRVVAEEKLLLDRKQRVREVRQGPDGAIYLIGGGGLQKLVPRR